jgi:hypothetical protein
MKIKIPANKVMPTGAFTIMSFRDKTYVCPGWVEVPNGTKFSDIEIVGLKKTIKVASKTMHKVVGSKGDIYNVVIDSKRGNSCSCVGFNYHRTCKHIKSVTNK